MQPIDHVRQRGEGGARRTRQERPRSPYSLGQVTKGPGNHRPTDCRWSLAQPVVATSGMTGQGQGPERSLSRWGPRTISGTGASMTTSTGHSVPWPLLGDGRQFGWGRQTAMVLVVAQDTSRRRDVVSGRRRGWHVVTVGLGQARD